MHMSSKKIIDGGQQHDPQIPEGKVRREQRKLQKKLEKKEAKREKRE